MITLLHKFLILLGLFVAVGTNAQVRRVVTCAESFQNSKDYVEVYDTDFVDVQPQFPGGESELIKYINKARRYPAEAYERNVHGRVLCGFIVNSDGSISHVSVLRGVEPTLNREAVRLISNMPKWEAGRVNNRAVPVYYILPIAFRR